MLYVEAADAQTITMLEQRGFIREATLRQDCCLDGRYADTVVMGQVKEKELLNKRRQGQGGISSEDA